MTRKQAHTRKTKSGRIVINPRISKLFKFHPGQEVRYSKDNKKYVIKRFGRTVGKYVLGSLDNKQILEDIPEVMIVTT